MPICLTKTCYIDNDLTITIKRVKGGKVSNYLIDNLKVGDKLEVVPPVGYFCYQPSNSPRHIVLIAGGSGITPLFSIIKNWICTSCAANYV